MVVHIDFSENYACKLYTEVQGFHWGGSRKQATVHTCVVYTSQGCQSYATISGSLCHDERAVWAHLEPILKEVKQQYPEITTLHVMSDGPVTQYRNRKNFYLTSTLPFLWGFKDITWNYSEKAHGKGAPGGVGAAAKRCADQHVRIGRDIQTPEALFATLEETSSAIRYFWISEDDVEI